MEVDLGHLRQDEVEELRPVEPPNLGVEVELLDDVAGFWVEGRDPCPQVAGDPGGDGEDSLEREAGGVVDLDPRDDLQDRADVLDGQPSEPVEEPRSRSAMAQIRPP